MKKNFKENAYEAEENYKQFIHDVIKLFPNEDDLIEWSYSCEHERLEYDLNGNLKNYLAAFSSVFDMKDEFREKIYEFFVSDVKLSVLMDESILISRKIDNKVNNDRFRVLFNTLNDDVFSEEKNMRIDNMTTNLYLKSLQPLVKLTLFYSKKKSKSLTDRFSGFKLVKASISKEGEFNVYQKAFEVLSTFLLSLERNQDNALPITFFNANTSFLDIHYLSEKNKTRIKCEKTEFDLHFDILTSVNSPIMKRITMKSYTCSSDALYFELTTKLISLYNYLFNKAKTELLCFLCTDVVNGSQQETMYKKFDHYKKIHSLLHKDESYEGLIEELISEIKSLDNYTEEYEYEEQSVEEALFKNKKISVLYSLEDFGESYKIIYEKESQK